MNTVNPFVHRVRTIFWLIVFLICAIILWIPQKSHAAESPPYPTVPELHGQLLVNQVQLEWQPNREKDFKRYHLLRTTLNLLPDYSDNEPIWSSDDWRDHRYTATVMLKEYPSYYYRLCVVNTANNVSCGNVLEVAQDRAVVSYAFFTDVERDSWYEPYVKALFRKQIVYSDLDQYFYPSQNVTRGELARLVVTALIRRGKYIFPFPPVPFCDVGRSHRDAFYINHGYQLGVVEGIKDSRCPTGVSFHPNQLVSRAEALKMIFLAFDYTPDPNVVKDETYPYNDTDLFLDVHQSDWFAPYVGRAKKEGIIEGYPDDTFKADRPVNRAEVAKMIQLMFHFE